MTDPNYVTIRAIASIIDEHYGDDTEATAWQAAQAIVDGGYAYPRLQSPLTREELGRRVCEVCLKWSREDDRPGSTATWDTLDDGLRELYMRTGEALFALGMTFSPAPPLPACDCKPLDDCAKCWTQVDPREVAIRQLAYCETSVQASADPEDGEQCPNLREYGSVYCAVHQPAPLPDKDLTGSLHVDGEDGPWYVRILDEDVHHTTEEAPSLIDWTRDGRMIGVELLGSGRERSPLPDDKPVQIETREWVITGEQIIDDPDEFAGTVFVRHNDLPEIFAALRAAEQEAPLPADETEWEWGYHWPDYGRFGEICSEETARFMATQDPPAVPLRRRAPGAWVEVKQS
jgi:hypothetical protein